MVKIYGLPCEFCFFVIPTSGEQKGAQRENLRRKGTRCGRGVGWGIGT
jgi:hypothetical protein